MLSDDFLSKADIIRAGSMSDKEAVRKAFEKLEFTIRMSHTQTELEELADDNIYQLRISQKSSDGTEYENIMIRWREDEFVVYSPSQGGPIGGTGNTLNKDPAIVYLNKPKRVSIQGTKADMKDAKKALYGRLTK